MCKNICYLLLILLIISCSQKNKSENKISSTGNDNISLLRTIVNKKPVASFFVPMGDTKLDRKFGVDIFETPQTFKFLLAMQYDAMLQSDTLQLPNFGVMPEIQIKPGPDKLSCIIGFLDEKKIFREYKLLSGKDEKLKLTTMKSYGVQTYTK